MPFYQPLKKQGLQGTFFFLLFIFTGLLLLKKGERKQPCLSHNLVDGERNHKNYCRATTKVSIPQNHRCSFVRETEPRLSAERDKENSRRAVTNLDMIRGQPQESRKAQGSFWSLLEDAPHPQTAGDIWAPSWNPPPSTPGPPAGRGEQGTVPAQGKVHRGLMPCGQGCGWSAHACLCRPCSRRR